MSASRESIPCSDEMFERCRVYRVEGECYQDIHHDYWPANQYRTPTEKEFRELEINKKFICRALHNAIHARLQASEKPANRIMKSAIIRSNNE